MLKQPVCGKSRRTTLNLHRKRNEQTYAFSVTKVTRLSVAAAMCELANPLPA